MRIPNRFVAPWFGYLTHLSDRSMERWHRMADEVDERTYGYDKLLSDVLQCWSDVTTGWMAAYQGGGSGGAKMPVVFFLLNPDTEADCEELSVFPPSLPHGEPAVAGVVPIVDGDKAQINDDNFDVCIYKRPPVLRVHVRLPKKDHPLKAGVYQGLIHIGKEPVATLMVKVRKQTTRPDCPPPPEEREQPCPPDQGKPAPKTDCG